jgi:anti-sigma-K factor RskA
MSPNSRPDPARDCDAIQDLIPDYAFGLTSAEETRLVDSNLPSCPGAAGPLSDFRRLQEEMRSSVPQIEPSAQLEARLMAAIATPLPIMPTAAPKAPRRVFALGWLAATAAVIALVVTNVFWLTRVNAVMQQNNELSAQILGQSGGQAFVLTSTANLRWVRLPPSQQNGDASAFLMWNGESEIGLLYAHGFPALSVGKSYQLWLTRGDTKVSAGTFRVDEQGKGALLFHSTQPIDQFTWARITDEPASGSDQPTGTAVVVGELSQQ